jgi:hypothetical protein
MACGIVGTPAATVDRWAGAIVEGVDNKAGSSDLPVGRLVERGVESYF